MRQESDARRRRLSSAGRKVGVPRTLAYDELRVFFDRLLVSHGLETVVSPPSSPRILEMGLERSIDEVCFPLKTFFGHVAALAASDVDTIFVPRLVSVAKGRSFCPKFRVLPDLVERTFPSLRVVSPHIDLHHARTGDLGRHLVGACRPALRGLGVWDRASKRRLEEAWAEESARRAAESTDGGDVTIAVLGHAYAERDPFLGLGVQGLLRGLGARVVGTPEGLPDRPVWLEDGVYYEPTVRLARAIVHHLERGADGIVLLTYFACGPDSYGADTYLYRLAARETRTPVLRLILDEHTTREGLLTRLATFVDLARERSGRPTAC